MTKKKIRLGSTYDCSLCGKQFSRPDLLKCHKKIHGEARFNCTECNYVGTTKKYLARHVERQHRKSKLKHQCPYCTRRFQFKSKMDQHMYVHTGEKPYKCESCEKSFNNHYSLNTHRLIHTGEKPFVCSFCSYCCRDSSTLRKHQNRHMGIEKVYHCNKCDKKFKQKPQLKMHIAEAHLKMAVRNHQCEICNKKYMTAKTLDVHVKQVHLRLREASCPFCGKVMSNAHNLSTHLLIHKDEKPYKCPHSGCPRACRDQSSLKRHIREVHSEERKYSCPHCFKGFYRNSHLKKHVRTHAERKRCVECDHCGSKFYSKNYLIKHIKAVHNPRIKLWECDECGFKARNKIGIILHINAGHSPPEKECRICHTIYKRQIYLKMHYLKTHGIRYKMKKVNSKRTQPIEIKQEPMDYDEMDDADSSSVDLFPVAKREVDHDSDSQKTLTEFLEAIASENATAEITDAINLTDVEQPIRDIIEAADQIRVVLKDFAKWGDKGVIDDGNSAKWSDKGVINDVNERKNTSEGNNVKWSGNKTVIGDGNGAKSCQNKGVIDDGNKRDDIKVKAKDSGEIVRFKDSNFNVKDRDKFAEKGRDGNSAKCGGEKGVIDDGNRAKFGGEKGVKGQHNRREKDKIKDNSNGRIEDKVGQDDGKVMRFKDVVKDKNKNVESGVIDDGNRAKLGGDKDDIDDGNVVKWGGEKGIINDGTRRDDHKVKVKDSREIVRFNVNARDKFVEKGVIHDGNRRQNTNEDKIGQDGEKVMRFKDVVKDKNKNVESGVIDEHNGTEKKTVGQDDSKVIRFKDNVVKKKGKVVKDKDKFVEKDVIDDGNVRGKDTMQDDGIEDIIGQDDYEVMRFKDVKDKNKNVESGVIDEHNGRNEDNVGQDDGKVIRLKDNVVKNKGKVVKDKNIFVQKGEKDKISQDDVKVMLLRGNVKDKGNLKDTSKFVERCVMDEHNGRDKDNVRQDDVKVMRLKDNVANAKSKVVKDKTKYVEKCVMNGRNEREKDKVAQDDGKIIQFKDDVIKDTGKVAKDKDTVVESFDKVEQFKDNVQNERGKKVQDDDKLIHSTDNVEPNNGNPVKDNDQVMENIDTVVCESGLVIHLRDTILQNKDNINDNNKVLRIDDKIGRENYRVLHGQDNVVEDNGKILDGGQDVKDDMQIIDEDNELVQLEDIVPDNNKVFKNNDKIAQDKNEDNIQSECKLVDKVIPDKVIHESDKVKYMLDMDTGTWEVMEEDKIQGNDKVSDDSDIVVEEDCSILGKVIEDDYSALGKVKEDDYSTQGKVIDEECSTGKVINPFSLIKDKHTQNKPLKAISNKVNTHKKKLKNTETVNSTPKNYFVSKITIDADGTMKIENDLKEEVKDEVKHTEGQVKDIEIEVPFEIPNINEVENTEIEHKDVITEIEDAIKKIEEQSTAFDEQSRTIEELFKNSLKSLSVQDINFINHNSSNTIEINTLDETTSSINDKELKLLEDTSTSDVQNSIPEAINEIHDSKREIQEINEIEISKFENSKNIKDVPDSVFEKFIVSHVTYGVNRKKASKEEIERNIAKAIENNLIGPRQKIRKNTLVRERQPYTHKTVENDKIVQSMPDQPKTVKKKRKKKNKNRNNEKKSNEPKQYTTIVRNNEKYSLRTLRRELSIKTDDFDDSNQKDDDWAINDNGPVDDNDNDSVDDSDSVKDNGKKNQKFQLNTHQCYVCFKLYSTKDELLRHCQEHFDICSESLLKKCPLCPYVGRTNFTKHMKSRHSIRVKINYANICDKKDNTEGSRYYYKLKNNGKDLEVISRNKDDTNTVIDKIEIIPSVKNLNRLAYTKIDKKNREEKSKAIAKSKLVKKGNEWIVMNEKIDINANDFAMPEKSTLESLGNDNSSYLKGLRKLCQSYKKDGKKMLFPCQKCDKVCQNLSALTLHCRKHDPDAKPFKKKFWKHKGQIVQKSTAPVSENRSQKPKPIKNKHKCDNRLKEFYKNNIRGGDIEFWQFLKIFNKMGRENIKDFKDLKGKLEYGIEPNTSQSETSNQRENVDFNNENCNSNDTNSPNTKNVPVATETSTNNANFNSTCTITSSSNAKFNCTSTKTSSSNAKFDCTSTKTSSKAKFNCTDTEALTKTKSNLAAVKNSNKAKLGLTKAKSNSVKARNVITKKEGSNGNFKRVIRLSKKEYERRKLLKQQLREKISKNM